jgi:hypothetical protein
VPARATTSRRRHASSGLLSCGPRPIDRYVAAAAIGYLLGVSRRRMQQIVIGRGFPEAYAVLEAAPSVGVMSPKATRTQNAAIRLDGSQAGRPAVSGLVPRGRATLCPASHALVAAPRMRERPWAVAWRPADDHQARAPLVAGRASRRIRPPVRPRRPLAFTHLLSRTQVRFQADGVSQTSGRGEEPTDQRRGRVDERTARAA